MAKAKDPAAVALGKRRWKGTTPEQRSEHASNLARQSAAAMTPAQRQARAKKAAKASAKVRKKKARDKKIFSLPSKDLRPNQKKPERI